MVSEYSLLKLSIASTILVGKSNNPFINLPIPDIAPNIISHSHPKAYCPAIHSIGTAASFALSPSFLPITSVAAFVNAAPAKTVPFDAAYFAPPATTFLVTALLAAVPAVSTRYFINVSNIPIAAPVTPNLLTVLVTHDFAGIATAVLVAPPPGAAAFALVEISCIPRSKLTDPPRSLTPPFTNSGAAFFTGSTGHSFVIFTPS